MMPTDPRPSPRLLVGPGRLADLGVEVAALGVKKVLVVTDPGIVAAGHVGRALEFLAAAGIEATIFEGTHTNPTESDIEACRVFAATVHPEALIGLGGGSSMDTAKGCNFLLNNGGRMADYRGYGLAKCPMLPFIAIPTTAGTGSECQSYALVSADDSHEKMACGDPKALARIAILDPELTASQPRSVATLTAIDALSHALESAVCTARTPVSSGYSADSFRLIAGSIQQVLAGTADLETRGNLLLGAALAGCAIENSMLGAAHAAANPLTASFNLAHGHAVALMLPHVIRLNSGDPAAAATYAEFSQMLGRPLLDWLEEILALTRLAPPAIPSSAIPALAAAACHQWTGRFNPVPLNESQFASLYRQALIPQHAPSL